MYTLNYLLYTIFYILYTIYFILYPFNYILYAIYYILYSSQGIDELDLKVSISVSMVRVHISAQPVPEYVLWVYVLSDERISYVQYLMPRFCRPNI